jgi:hypothetical protein
MVKDEAGRLTVLESAEGAPRSRIEGMKLESLLRDRNNVGRGYQCSDNEQAGTRFEARARMKAW